MRTLRGLAALTAASIVVAGCGSDPESAPSADIGTSTHSSTDHAEEMPGMDMGSSADGPSETAAMICTDEIEEAVVATLDLSQTPGKSDDWSDLLYTCTYALPTGDLVLTVKDSADEPSGMDYFDTLESRLDKEVSVQPIRGLAGLGLPSYESRNGHVVFIKDGKTLHVDATDLPRDVGQAGQTRTEVAYQVATDVIACWSE